MFALQRITRQAPRALKLYENQCRTHIATPPRVRVSFAEKVMHGVFLYIGIMLVPVYVSCNVLNYRQKKS